MKTAVIGGGISGLSCAYALEQHLAASGRTHHDVTLFEANDYFGGHANTVDLTFDTADGPVTHGVDTGFLVFNERTYPLLIQLFAELGVETAASDMSFSVSLPHAGAHGLEWAGTDLGTLFAQRRNLLRPAFHVMLWDILRFNRLTTALARSGTVAESAEPLGSFLDRHGFSAAFRDWYLLPMTGCIWSCSTEQMRQFPIGTLIQFCHNHGLLQISDRPRWHTVRGGSRHYVERMLRQLRDARLSAVRAVRRVDGVGQDQAAPGYDVVTDAGIQQFDQVVFACHSDQALALLENPTPAERSVLSAVRYQDNRAVLHCDSSLLPARKALWSAWNYSARPAGARPDGDSVVCVNYLINRLQPLPAAWDDRPVIVSLNPVIEPREDLVMGEFHYAHPLFDRAALAAQARLPDIQGQHGAWYCGAWTGYGFHEDGLKSGLEVAARIALRQSLEMSSNQNAA